MTTVGLTQLFLFDRQHDNILRGREGREEERMGKEWRWIASPMYIEDYLGIGELMHCKPGPVLGQTYRKLLVSRNDAGTQASNSSFSWANSFGPANPALSKVRLHRISKIVPGMALHARGTRKSRSIH